MRDLSDKSAVQVEALPQTGMITLRVELTEPGLGETLARLGLSLPATREILTEGAGQIAWMSPDELMLIVPLAEVQATIDTLKDGLSDAHVLVADVSDARARFALSGPGARETLAKLCPVDLAPGHFQPGELRRTRLAQVAGAFWMTGPESFEIVCFRSVADYVERLLRDAAAMGVEGLSL